MEEKFHFLYYEYSNTKKEKGKKNPKQKTNQPKNPNETNKKPTTINTNICPCSLTVFGTEPEELLPFFVK